MYCNIAASSALRHDGHVIAANIFLPVAPVRQGEPGAVIAAAEFPLPAAADVAGQGRVENMQIANHLPARPADMLHMAPHIGGGGLGGEQAGRVAVGDVGPLERRQRGGVKHVLRLPDHLDHALRVAVQPQLTGQILHFPRAGDGRVGADDTAVRLFHDMLRQLCAIVGEHRSFLPSKRKGAALEIFSGAGPSWCVYEIDDARVCSVTNLPP